MNKAIISGNLGRDPEVRQTNSGTTVCNFSVATSEKYNGEEQTEWHRVVVFGNQADACGKYLNKGSYVVVEGKITYGSYTDKDGNERHTTEIIARHVEFVRTGSTGGSTPAPADPAPVAPRRGPRAAPDVGDVDCPF